MKTMKVHRFTPEESEQLNQELHRLKQLGYTQKQISERVHLSQSAVSSRLNRGRTPQPRLSNQGMVQRDTEIVRLRSLGYTMAQISAAVGIAASEVSRRLQKLGRSGPRVTKAPSIPPPPPPTPDAPSYLNSTTLQLWRSILITSQQDNAANRLAFDANDAIIAGDDIWLRDARTLLTDVTEHLTQLTAVLDDADTRAQAIGDPTQRNDMKAALRLITSDLAVCVFCGTPLSTGKDTGNYQRVTGWERRRSGGGANQVRLPERSNEWACAQCVAARSPGTGRSGEPAV